MTCSKDIKKMPQGLHKYKASEILSGLSRFESEIQRLPGISDPRSRHTFAMQIISSLRRVEYIRSISNRSINANRCIPTSALFDPLRAAALLSRRRDFDEAVWMTFIATHFGKHLHDGWKLAANVTGSFGDGPIWTAALYNTDRLHFEKMLKNNQINLNNPAVSGRYSNHRQYQSKNSNSIARVFQTFFDWQFAEGGFLNKINHTHRLFGQNPTQTFDALFHSMKGVYGFGRLGKFDFLAMVGKLQIAPIEPCSVYLHGATGPLAGAKLLFYGSRNHFVKTANLQESVDELDRYIQIGKQPLEDSLCNWQKSPLTYIYFKG